MRRISLRSTKKAGGATTKLKNDISGSCHTITPTRPISDKQIASERRDQQIDHLRCGRRAGGQARDEFGRMAVGEEAEAFVEQLGKNGALIVGDDAVADARQHHAESVSGDALAGEQRDRHAAQEDDAGEIAADVGFVDDGADEIGARRRASGGNPHQRESDEVSAPMPHSLLGEQAADQNEGAVLRIGGRWQDVFVHSPSVGPDYDRFDARRLPCLRRTQFSSQNTVKKAGRGEECRFRLTVKRPRSCAWPKAAPRRAHATRWCRDPRIAGASPASSGCARRRRSRRPGRRRGAR